MRRSRALTAVAVAIMAVAGGTGAALAVTGSSNDGATGPDADKAVAAALKLTDGGTANAVERDNEKGATWEVEVKKPDGTTVDVRLDASYRLVAIDSDSENADAPDTNEDGGK